MSSKRGSSKRRSTKRSSASAGAPAEPAGEEAKAPNGILITVAGGDGDEDQELSIQPLGDVKQTELPGLLGVARNIVEARLGIGRG